MTPRDYQQLRIDGAVDLLRSGANCAIVLPTGTGKTATALWIAERMLAPKGGEVLWIVDAVALVDQTREKAAELGVPVTVKTVQGLRSVGGKPAIDPGRYRIIVVDEAHRHLTEKRMAHLVAAETPLLLLTATPRRGDGKHIEELGTDGYVGGPYTLGQAIEDGWLCDCKVLRVDLLELDLGGVKATGRDFDKEELAEVMNVPSHNEEIVKRWLEVGRGKTSNLFAVNCAHADALCAEVNRQSGADVCRAIHQKIPSARRLVQDFRRGEFAVASSVMMVAEGFDLPGLEVGVLARPTKSERLLVQMLGRFLRVAEGKDHATLLDCAGSYEGLDLAGIYDVVARPEVEARSLTESDPQPAPDAIPMLSDVISRVREIDLFRRRCADAREELPWVRVGEQYVLALNGAWLVVARSKHDHSKAAAALLYRRKHRALCRVVTTADDEPEAFAKAVALARDSGRAWRGEAADVGKWYRDREEPSESQLSALARHEIDGSLLQRGEAQFRIRKLHARREWVPAEGGET